VDNHADVRTFRTLDLHLRLQAGDHEGGASADDVNDFAATRAVDDHVIGCTVARPGPAARREVDINLRNVGIAQVIDGDGVGAPESHELNVLDIVEIHADAGNIAGEQRVPALGGDVDGFVDIRTIEQERIGIIAAVDDIAAVARIPDEGIVAGAKL